MIKGHEFREALGLTQEETAMLLRISMSQLSMFEIGQRGLSSEAMLKLLNMYNYVQNKPQEDIDPHILKTDTDKMTLLLEEELKENQYEQMVFERKINEFKRKYQKSISTLKLVEYLERRVQKQDKYDKELADMFREKALKGIEKNGLVVQTPYNLKLKSLQLHQKELQKQLMQFT